MATDNEKATWLRQTMDITANDMFDRDFDELIKKHQVSVIVGMIENRDFKGL